MLKFTRRIILLLAAFSLASCSVASTPVLVVSQPTPTPEVTVQVTPSPSATAIPTITTSTVTSSPIPPTDTSTPEPLGLNATGPFILFRAHSGLWAANPDGSIPTLLTDYDLNTAIDLRHFISPNGDRLALVESNDTGLDLVVIDIPGGTTEKIAHLIDSPPPEQYDPTSANSFATYAIRDYESVAWQPGEGNKLAFIGAINGSTADLYVYDAQTKEITQLTDGPSQAVLPVWSPDGKYILHFGVSWVPPFGGAIGGANQLDGVWAVRASDGKIITLPKNAGNSPHFLGWLDDSHYITYDSGECSSENLHSVDVVSGETTSLMQASFYYYIDYSPENGSIMFSSAEGCENSLGEGIFLLPAGETTPVRLYNQKAWGIEWMPESRVFNAYPEGLFADGSMFYEPPVYNKSYHPALSEHGYPAISEHAYQAWEVIENYQGRVELRIDVGEWLTIFNGPVDELIWDPVDGETLVIAMQDGSIFAATYPDFTPQHVGDLGGGVMQAIWVP
jgi:hypothetical protein